MSEARSLALLIAGLLLSAASMPQAGSLTSEMDGMRVELASNPGDPRAEGETEYVARLMDRAGKPVTGAQVTLRGRMADGMSMLAPLRPVGEAGMYRGRVLFMMEGQWGLTLRVIREGKRVELPFTEHVAR